MEFLKYDHDCCELTGETGALHLHHVIFRSQGGDDIRANVVCMTQLLHERYHRGDEDVRAMLATYIEQHRHDTKFYLLSKLGPGGKQAWFAKHKGEEA